MHDPLVATLVVASLLVVGLLSIRPLASRYPTPADPNSHPDDPKPLTTDRTLVVDRITDDEAVLLVEADDENVDCRRVPVESLPADGRYEGSVLQETSHGYAVDSGATDGRSKTARRRFENLSTPLTNAARLATG